MRNEKYRRNLRHNITKLTEGENEKMMLKHDFKMKRRALRLNKATPYQNPQQLHED